MIKRLLFILLISFVNCSIFGENFVNGMDTDLNDIVKYDNNTYGVWTRIIGTKQMKAVLDEKCKKSGMMGLPHSCQKYADGSYVAHEWKTYGIINIKYKTECFTNISIFDKYHNIIDDASIKCNEYGNMYQLSPNSSGYYILQFIKKNKSAIDKISEQ